MLLHKKLYHTCNAYYKGKMTHLLFVKNAPISQHSTLFMDDTLAIYLTKGPILHSRMKHIVIKYYVVWDLVEKDMVKTTFIFTKKMVADIFTKLLNKCMFEKQRTRLGLIKLTILKGS